VNLLSPCSLPFNNKPIMNVLIWENDAVTEVTPGAEVAITVFTVHILTLGVA